MIKFISIFAFSVITFLSDPAFAKESNVNFSVIVTAESSGSLEAMVVSGGSWFTKRKLVHTAVLITHPKGNFLFDSGIGKQYESQMSEFGFLDKQLFKIENVQPAVDQFKAQNFHIPTFLGIIPSHMHWDHASGLEDFSTIPVWVQQVSLDEALLGKPPAFLKSQYDDPQIKWKPFDMENAVYEGFEVSLDLYGDGSAVLVDLSGHTQGQVGLFINLSEQERYFFIGDTTWSIAGVNQNKPRPVFVDWMVGVDTNYEQNNAVVEKLHKLSNAKPEIKIVPAHDELVIQTLPRYPVFYK